MSTLKAFIFVIVLWFYAGFIPDLNNQKNGKIIQNEIIKLSNASFNFYIDLTNDNDNDEAKHKQKTQNGIVINAIPQTFVNVQYSIFWYFCNITHIIYHLHDLSPPNKM